MNRPRVVIVGAIATGKTWLTHALRAHLPAELTCLESNELPQPSDTVLLMGLDLTPPSAVQQAQDAQWRHDLGVARLAYQVIYGQGDARLHQALHALARLLATQHPGLAERLLRQEPAVRWQGLCDACSDPVCEHRLFGRLLAQRQTPSLQ